MAKWTWGKKTELMKAVEDRGRQGGLSAAAIQRAKQEAGDLADHEIGWQKIGDLADELKRNAKRS